MYLRTYIEHRRTTPETLSLRSIAAGAGISHPYLVMILNGKRSMDEDLAQRVAAAAELTRSETSFLVQLVRLDNASDPEARQEIMRQLARRQAFRDWFRIDSDMLEFFSLWYVGAIHVMIGAPGFQPEPRWISERLRPNVTAKMAKDALELLLNLGLAEVDADGTWRQCQRQIATPDELHHEIIRGYHAQINNLAGWALEQVPPEERSFGSITVAVDAEGAEALRQKMHQLRHEVIEFARSLSTDEHSILMTLNLQAFPISHQPTSDEDSN